MLSTSIFPKGCEEDTEAVINSLKEEMEQCAHNAQMGLLLGSVVHDFRNLLTTLGLKKDGLGILLKKISAAIPEECHREILDNLEQINSIGEGIDQIIELGESWASSILSGFKKGSKKLQSLSSLIEDVLLIFKGKISHENILISVEVQEEQSVLCDKGGVIRVLINLILNSMQALEKIEGERKINIRLFCTETEAYIAIIDNGIKIPDDVLPMIFQRITTKGEGTGFGLFLAKKVMDEHNGKIRVKNMERGKMFLLSFPILR